MALSDIQKQKIKDLVMGVVSRLDNDKNLNVERYTAMFKDFDLHPEKFEAWAATMGNNLDDTIQIFCLPFEEPQMTQIKAAADFMHIPLEEYIWYRDHGPENIRTKMKVPVGYIPIKRVQQLLAKKNAYSFDNDKTDLKTGQVKGDSKVSSLSDPEAFCLSAIGADSALKEFLGPRADNNSAKNAMYRSIAKDGYATLEDLPNDPSSKTTLNTVNTYFLASGIKSDLITNGYKTYYTVESDLHKKN